jgi:hypothetical protein
MQRHSSHGHHPAQRQHKSAAEHHSANPASVQLKRMPPALQAKVAQMEGLKEEEPVSPKLATAQMEGLEEEPVSPKLAVAQFEGLEEEPVSPKLETAQFEGLEEEPVSPKMAVAQFAGLEDKEPAMGKFIAPVQRQENKTGLPDQLKAGVESLSGHSLDDVKVHYNSSQPAQLNALAYAQGTDIHVGPGQEQHLPHEAWHVAQQKSGRVEATTQLAGGVPANTDPGLEHEADVMGAKAMQMKWENASSPT